MPDSKTPQRSFLSTMAAVAWSFVGLRRRKDFEEDVTALNPVYVIFGGILGTALFIGLLLTIVRTVVS